MFVFESSCDITAKEVGVVVLAFHFFVLPELDFHGKRHLSAGIYNPTIFKLDIIFKKNDFHYFILDFRSKYIHVFTSDSEHCLHEAFCLSV